MLLLIKTILLEKSLNLHLNLTLQAPSALSVFDHFLKGLRLSPEQFKSPYLVSSFPSFDISVWMFCHEIFNSLFIPYCKVSFHCYINTCTLITLSLTLLQSFNRNNQDQLNDTMKAYFC